MKKLRFITFMMGAVLMSAGFTACSSDDDDQVSISFDSENPTEVTEGHEFEVKFSVVSDSKLTKITVIHGEKNIKTVNEKEIVNKTSYSGSITEIAILNDEAKLEYTVIAIDKNGLEDIKKFTVKVNAIATPLSEVEEVVLTYKGANSTQNTSDILGIKYVSNVDGNTAKFSIFSTEEKFAIISEEIANSISSKEELIAAYDASTEKEDQFTAKSDVNFKNIWLISKVGDEYVWIEFASLKFKAGDNRAVFNFKK